MSARIYVIPLSTPAAAGAAMVAHKRLPHRAVSLPPGVHPLLVRGCPGGGSTRRGQGRCRRTAVLDGLV